MSSQNQSFAINRRDFIRALSLATCALALTPLELLADNSQIYSPTSLQSIPRPLELGTLLPNSIMYPGLSENWLAGMNLYFRQAGGAPVSLLAQATPNRWRTDHALDLLAGIGGANVGLTIDHLSSANRSVFIANDAGANVIRHHEINSNIFHNSLGYWQANTAMGKWAVQQLGRRAFVASAFYESGYDLLYAFQSGLENAGGQVAETFIAHVPPVANNLPDLISAIKRVQPDFVYAFFSGTPAVDFIRAYADSGLLNRIPLAGSAFLVDEMILPRLGDAALNIYSGLSWSPTLQTVENQTFTTAFQQMTRRAPDGFAVLGYDTARWIAEALNQVGGDLTQMDRLREAFRAVRFSSPRGSFGFDSQTQTSTTPLYLRQVQSQDGKLVNQVVGELESVSINDTRFTDLRAAQRSGWTHAYLAV